MILFVVGLLNEKIQYRLLNETTLSFVEPCDIAMNHEMTENELRSSNQSTNINAIGNYKEKKKTFSKDKAKIAIRILTQTVTCFKQVGHLVKN